MRRQSGMQRSAGLAVCFCIDLKRFKKIWTSVSKVSMLVIIRTPCAPDTTVERYRWSCYSVLQFQYAVSLLVALMWTTLFSLSVSCPIVTTYFDVPELLFPCHHRRGVRQIMKSQVLINEEITQKASICEGKAMNFYQENWLLYTP